jgi:hypothetical protein
MRFLSIKTVADMVLTNSIHSVPRERVEVSQEQCLQSSLNPDVLWIFQMFWHIYTVVSV